MEVLQHTHDVLALAWAPSGKMLASATLDGQIYLWDPLEAELLVSIVPSLASAGPELNYICQPGMHMVSQMHDMMACTAAKLKALCENPPLG